MNNPSRKLSLYYKFAVDLPLCKLVEDPSILDTYYFSNVNLLSLFVCLSEDEWKRINTAINSGSAAVPTAIIVGAAALAALFL